MNGLSELQQVEVTRPPRNGNLSVGERGTIVHVYSSVSPGGTAFEVEFSDGRVVTLKGDQLRPATVAPVVHLNGTSREALKASREVLLHALNDADRKLAEAAPNGRDYYPVVGLMDQATRQHAYRQGLLRELISSVETELLAIDEA